VLRLNRGLKPYYSATRFRLISEPRITEIGIELDLAPMDFTYRMILDEESVEESVKEHVLAKIREIAGLIPNGLQSSHPTFNAFNSHPLGVEIVIVTKDQRTLLRKRGESVLLARSEWDVSYSGYCGDKDMLRRRKLDVALTVQRELQREIGVLPADPSEILFTGIHRNTVTGAIDVLGVWPTELRTEKLAKLITDKYPGLGTEFETTERADEDFVWGTKNLIVDFNTHAISQAIKNIGISEGRPAHLIPEAFASLVLALKATGNPVGELMA
jgi:hypothetical protein